MVHVTHLLNGLAIGGMERAALRLAAAGLHRGQRHDMMLYDTPFRSGDLDFDPGPVTTRFLRRGAGIDIAFAARLARSLWEGGTQVVHAHNNTALFYAALARLLLPQGAPRLLATIHTWPTHASGRARVLTRLAARTGRVFAVSDELAARLTGAGWLHRCGTIWNGVDLGHFTPARLDRPWRRRLGIADDAILVGHVARMDPIKRHADLLHAAARLQATAPRVTLLLIGQGPLEDEIRHAASGLSNVRFVPHTRDMPALMRSLDLFVLCSTHEGAPLSLLEAMASGLPVVATSVGGIPVLLGQGAGAAGILVPPLDPAALAAAIEALSRDARQREALGKAAAGRAARFSFETEWAAYEALYAGAAIPSVMPPEAGRSEAGSEGASESAHRARNDSWGSSA